MICLKRGNSEEAYGQPPFQRSLTKERLFPLCPGVSQAQEKGRNPTGLHPATLPTDHFHRRTGTTEKGFAATEEPQLNILSEKLPYDLLETEEKGFRCPVS